MTTSPMLAMTAVEERPILSIVPSPTNPRTYFDPVALDQLAASIKAKGMQQPLVVRTRADGKLELIHGERRLRAAQLAGRAWVPVIVREWDDAQVTAAQLAEMGQARDVSAWDKARAFALHMKREKLTQAQLSQEVGLSEPMISEYLSLLLLPDDAKALFRRPGMTGGHGRELARLGAQPAKQAAVVAALRAALQAGSVPGVKALRAEISAVLGRPAPAVHKPKGKSKRRAAARGARVVASNRAVQLATKVIPAAHRLALVALEFKIPTGRGYRERLKGAARAVVTLLKGSR